MNHVTCPSPIDRVDRSVSLFRSVCPGSIPVWARVHPRVCPPLRLPRCSCCYALAWLFCFVFFGGGIDLATLYWWPARVPVPARPQPHFPGLRHPVRRQGRSGLRDRVHVPVTVCSNQLAGGCTPPFPIHPQPHNLSSLSSTLVHVVTWNPSDFCPTN